MLRIQYCNNELFEYVKKSKVFKIMDQNKLDHLTITENTVTQNMYLNKLKYDVYEQLKRMNCDVLKPTEENFIMEFWNTTFDKHKKIQRTSLDWHTDDYELIPYKTYTAILYFYKSDGITGGNLKIMEEKDIDNTDIKIIDTWSMKTLLIFEGDLYHCPQEVTVINNDQTLKRQIVTMFFARDTSSPYQSIFNKLTLF
jgi:hypothetical protein